MEGDGAKICAGREVLSRGADLYWKEGEFFLRGLACRLVLDFFRERGGILLCLLWALDGLVPALSALLSCIFGGTSGP